MARTVVRVGEHVIESAITRQSAEDLGLKLENRIFGNSALPEYLPDQVFAGFALALGIVRGHESVVSRLDVVVLRHFSFDAAPRHLNQGAAHRQMPFLRDPSDRGGQWRRNGDALPY